MDFEYIVVLVTAPSAEVGKQIADRLLDQRLAACVNILPAVRSLYTWKGAVQDDAEVLLVVKSRSKLFQEGILPAVKAVHPYENPEIIALPILDGSTEYLDWIVAETS